MSTSSGSTTMKNINSRQVNSDEAIRDRQEDDTEQTQEDEQSRNKS